MTRLTNLYLSSVRGKHPKPIPFPTQFCNMIYLQRFTSINNNFSGFRKNVSCNLLMIFLLGPIPFDLTRLVGLRRLNLFSEPSLQGFKKIWLIILFFVLKGEFPLIEGSFKNLVRSFLHSFTSKPFNLIAIINILSCFCG